MRVSLRNVVPLAGFIAENCDLHEEFGFAAAREEGDSIALFVNGVRWHAWPKPELFYLVNVDVKWRKRGQVLVYLGGSICMMASRETWKAIDLGWLERLFTSKNYIFASYGEEAVYSAARTGDIEAQAMGVFSSAGEFLFGLADLFAATKEKQSIADVGCAYTYDDCIVFHGSEVDCLWHLETPSRRVDKIPVPFSTTCLDVLAGDGHSAFAIYDSRALASSYPGLPLFECARFDLRSQAASMLDFGHDRGSLDRRRIRHGHDGDFESAPPAGWSSSTASWRRWRWKFPTPSGTTPDPGPPAANVRFGGWACPDKPGRMPVASARAGSLPLPLASAWPARFTVGGKLDVRFPVN